MKTGTAGLEPAAGGLEIRYSIQLSYAPNIFELTNLIDLNRLYLSLRHSQTTHSEKMGTEGKGTHRGWQQIYRPN